MKRFIHKVLVIVSEQKSHFTAPKIIHPPNDLYDLGIFDMLSLPPFNPWKSETHPEKMYITFFGSVFSPLLQGGVGNQNLHRSERSTARIFYLYSGGLKVWLDESMGGKDLAFSEGKTTGFQNERKNNRNKRHRCLYI